MEVITLEGVVDNGQIRLKDNIHLPDKTIVYVIVPGVRAERLVRVISPRLVHREQAGDFEMKITEADPDAGV